MTTLEKIIEEKLKELPLEQLQNIALVRAIARVQAKLDKILKNKTASAKYSYKYASLDHIMEHISDHLAGDGLVVTWDTTQEIRGRFMLLSVTCYVTHVLGGKNSSTITLPIELESVDQRTGETYSRNLVQMVGAARTYGCRYTLLSALGITVGEEDTDGVPEQPQPTNRDMAPEKPTGKSKVAEKKKKSFIDSTRDEYVKIIEQAYKILKNRNHQKLQDVDAFLAKQGVSIEDVGKLPVQLLKPLAIRLTEIAKA